jgi:hypothetical protein
LATVLTAAETVVVIVVTTAHAVAHALKALKHKEPYNDDDGIP